MMKIKSILFYEKIPSHKIYIPEFIDLDANQKYIDYILQTNHSVNEDSKEMNPLLTDFRHKIHFRNKKMIFEKSGIHYDFVRGIYRENPNTRDLSDLWKETLEDKEKVKQNSEKIKSLLK